jgi:hypothetical protein
MSWRIFVCGLAIVCLPTGSMADGRSVAILRTRGTVLVNGSQAPISTALFPNDTVETQAGASAVIEGTGWTLTVGPRSVTRFEGDALSLESGTVQVTSLSQFQIRVDCHTMFAVSVVRTLYDVSDTDGRVVVAAQRNDVHVQRGNSLAQAKDSTKQSDSTVYEGKQQTLPETCRGPAKFHIAATDGLLNTPTAKAIGIGAIGGLACVILCSSIAPASPAQP